MKFFCILSLFILLYSCNNGSENYDASGTFEATEITISSEAAGKLLTFDISEGENLPSGKMIGIIDTVQLYTQKRQIESSIVAVKTKIPDITLQTASLQQQLNNALIDKQRIENLYNDNVATKKQVDDITTQVATLQKQIDAQKDLLSQTTAGIQADVQRLEMQLKQIDDLLRKSYIINPVAGVILSKYKERSEFVSQGIPLYKIADISTLFLRAFVTGEQLPQITIGQTVTVRVDNGSTDFKTYSGTVAWISEKAEFTPKTIQTKHQRANLVYALKIAVKNDGFIKIGQYGDVKFADNL